MARTLRNLGSMRNLFRSLGGLAAILFCLAGTVHGQDKGGLKYRLEKGSFLKYDVTLELSCTLRGSDPCFLTQGDTPYKMTLNGQFEQTTTAVDDASKAATIERKVKVMNLAGAFNGNEFKMEWSRDKDKTFKKEEITDITQYWYEWTQTAHKFNVTPEGDVTPENDNFKRLVNRMGMMYWPLGGQKEVKDGKETGAWINTEEFAIPAIHDHLWFDFRNELGKSTSRDGKKLLQIVGKPSMNKKHALPELSPIPNLDVEYKVDGKVVLEYDQGAQRVHSVSVDLSITFSGKGSSPEGNEAPVKGHVVYKETQTLKE